MASDTVSHGLARSRRGIRTIRGHLVLSLLSGIMLALAFPSPGWGWLSYFALIPVGILAVRSTSRWRLGLSIWLVFSLWWLYMVRWMIPVTGGGYVAMALFLALFPAAAAVTLHFLRSRIRCAMLVALPMVWVSFEFLRGTFPFGGFSWYALGDAVLPWAPGQPAGHIVQIADIFGQYGVSFVVAMTSGGIVDLLTLPMVRKTRTGRTRPRRTVSAVILLWAAAFFGSYAYGSYRIGQTPTVTRQVAPIAVVQTNVPQSNKNNPTPGTEAKDWEHLLGLATRAAASQPRPALIVWPETMVPAPLNSSFLSFVRSYHGSADRYDNTIAHFARSFHIAVLAGADAYTDIHRTITPQGQVAFQYNRFNAAFLYYRDGSKASRDYRKMHLVPFGEYIPLLTGHPAWKMWVIRHLTPYSFDFTTHAGHQIVVFHLPMAGTPEATSTQPTRVKPSSPASTTSATRPSPHLLSFATPICFEDTISSLCRQMVYGDDGRKRAQALINLTNDGWFAGSYEPIQHEQLAAMRCIEDRVPMARSVNTGVSGFIDSLGRIGPTVLVNGRRLDIAGFATHRLRIDSRTTIYAQVGRVPIVSMVVITFVIVLISLTQRDRRGT